METFLMQDWTTIRGATPITQVVQEQDQWLDLTPYGSVFFWLDCRTVSGTSTILQLDTSPCVDDSFFAPLLVSGVNLAAGQSPVLVYAGFPGVSILARYVRWRITSSGSAAWDVTFRLWCGAVVPGM